MKVTCEAQDYSNPAKQNIRIHNSWLRGTLVEIEIGETGTQLTETR